MKLYFWEGWERERTKVARCPADPENPCQSPCDSEESTNHFWKLLCGLNSNTLSCRLCIEIVKERKMPVTEGRSRERKTQKLSGPWHAWCQSQSEDLASSPAHSQEDSPLLLQQVAPIPTSSLRTPEALDTGHRGGGREAYAPCCSVIFCPDTDKLIQVVRPQDGWVPSQVLKVVHDDGHEQVEHLEGEGEKGS